MEGKGMDLINRESNIFFNNDILAYYETHSIESRLPCLRPSMLKKDGGGFKLRAKGGEARSLVGILPTLIEKYLEEGLPLERAMGHTGQQLVKIVCLSVREPVVSG